MADSWQYIGDDEREIPALRLIVKKGDKFQVEDKELSAGLEGQDMFEKVKASPKTRSSTTTSEEG